MGISAGPSIVDLNYLFRANKSSLKIQKVVLDLEAWETCINELFKNKRKKALLESLALFVYSVPASLELVRR